MEENSRFQSIKGVKNLKVEDSFDNRLSAPMDSPHLRHHVNNHVGINENDKLDSSIIGSSMAAESSRGPSYSYQQYGSTAGHDSYAGHSSHPPLQQPPPTHPYYGDQTLHRYPPLSQQYSQHHLPPLSLPNHQHEQSNSTSSQYNQHGASGSQQINSQSQQQPRYQYLPPLNSQHLPSPHSPQQYQLSNYPIHSQSYPPRPRQYSNPNPSSSNLAPFNSSSAGATANEYNYIQQQHAQQQQHQHFEQNRFPPPPPMGYQLQRGRSQTTQHYNLPQGHHSTSMYAYTPPTSLSNQNSPILNSRLVPSPTMPAPGMPMITPLPYQARSSTSVVKGKARAKPKKRGKKMKFEDSDDSNESEVEEEREFTSSPKNNDSEGMDGIRIGQRRSDRARSKLIVEPEAERDIDVDEIGSDNEKPVVEEGVEEEEDELDDEDDDSDPSFTPGQNNELETVISKRKRNRTNSTHDYGNSVEPPYQAPVESEPRTYQPPPPPMNNYIDRQDEILPPVLGTYHPQSLPAHLDIHTNPNSAVVAANNKKDQEKRFVCPSVGCGRAFARNFNLQSHIKSHTGIREFDCPDCIKKFSRKHDRQRHCQSVHKWIKDPITGIPYPPDGRAPLRAVI